MAKTLTTQIVFNGVNNVSRVISGIQTSAVQLSNKLKNIGDGFRNAGFQASAVSLPATFLLKDTVDQFADVEDANVRLNALMDDGKESAAELAKIQKQLIDQQLDVAAKTKFSQLQTAEGMIEMSKAGMAGPQIIKSMQDIANQAIVMQQDLATTAAMGNSMVTAIYGDTFDKDADGYAKKIRELGDLTVWLANKTMASATEAQQFMKTLSPMIHSMGMDEKGMTALGVVLGKQGFVGSNDAAKAARSIAMRLADPSSKGLGTLAGLGIDTEKFFKGEKTPVTKKLIEDMLGGTLNMDKVDTGKLQKILTNSAEDAIKRTQKALKVLDKSHGGIKPEDRAFVQEQLYQLVSGQAGQQFDFVGAMDELSKMNKVKPLGLQQLNPIVGKERAQQFMALLNNWDQYRDALKDVENSQGIVTKQADKFSTSLKVLMDNLQGAFQGLQYRIFAPVAEDVKAIFQGIIDKMDSFGKVIANNPGLAKVVVLVTALLAVLGPALIAIGLMASGMAALAGAAALVFSPLVMAARGVALFSAALFGAARTSRMALVGLLRFSAVGAILAGAALVIYRSWDKIKAAFASVDWAKMKAMATGFIDALMHGDWGRMAELMKGIWHGIEPAVTASLNALKASVSKLWADIVKTIDSYTPNFAGFRDAVGNLADSLRNFFSVFAGSDETLSAVISWLKEIGRAIADKTFKGASDVLRAVARGINALTTAINNFKGGYGKGGVFEGLRETLAGMGGDFRLLAATTGIWGLSAGLTALKSAAVALKGINVMGLFAGLGPMKIFMAAAAIGYLTDKLGLLSKLNEALGTNFDWVDAFSAALLGLSAVKLLGGFFSSATSAAATNGALAGSAYGNGFGGAARLALKGLGAWAAYEIIKDMPSTAQEWNDRIAQNKKRDADISKWLVDNIFDPMTINLGWGKDGQGDYANSPAAKMIEYIKSLAPKVATNTAAAVVKPYTGDDSGMQATAYELERRRRQMESLLNPANDPSKSWDVSGMLKGAIYGLMKPTEDRLFERVQTPVNNALDEIKRLTTDQLPGKSKDDAVQLESLGEMRNTSAASNRAAAATEAQAGKIDTTNTLLGQISGGISGLQGIMSSIPGAITRNVAATIRANNSGPKAASTAVNKVNSNSATNPTTLGHR